jgi:hypothetical protein
LKEGIEERLKNGGRIIFSGQWFTQVNKEKLCVTISFAMVGVDIIAGRQDSSST